jgi:energy-coupling factor transporter ATP-binding protein EcfA2
MFETIKEIRDEGHSILIVEQDLIGTLAISDYGYVMESGRITVEGPPAELRDNPLVRASIWAGKPSRLETGRPRRFQRRRGRYRFRAIGASMISDWEAALSPLHGDPLYLCHLLLGKPPPPRSRRRCS